jgi:hypothetical protein
MLGNSGQKCSNGACTDSVMELYEQRMYFVFVLEETVFFVCVCMCDALCLWAPHADLWQIKDVF